MNILVIGTVATRPHLETSGELALKYAKGGHNVTFCWLGDIPTWSEWDLPISYKVLGCSFKRRIKKFESLLAQNGVDIVSPPKLSLTEKTDIATWAAQPISDQTALRTLVYENASLGMGVASSIISLTRNSEYDPSEDGTRVQRALASAALLFKHTQKLITAHKADQLVIFNGRFANSRPCVQAAKLADIEILRHDLGSQFSKYETYTDAIHNFGYITQKITDHWTQSTVHTDAEKAKIASDFYDKKRAGIPVAFSATGGNTYTNEQEIGNFPPKIDGKKRVVYYPSSDDEFAAIADDPTAPQHNQRAAFQNLIDAAAQDDSIDLVIRLHPNFKNKAPEAKARWHAYESDAYTLIKEDASVDTYALMESADLVVTYGSSVGMEAAYNGKPVMILGKHISTYEHIKGIYHGLDVAQISDILAMNTWDIVAQEDTFPYAYYFNTHGQNYAYYQPNTPLTGTFLGQHLWWESRLLRGLRALKQKLK